MPRPTRTHPIPAGVGALLGAAAGPLGAGIGGLVGAALGTSSLSLEDAVEGALKDRELEFSNLRWLNRRSVDVVFADEQRIFHRVRLSASRDLEDFEEISDDIYDQFVEALEGF